MDAIISSIPCVVPLDVVFSRFECLDRDQDTVKDVAATTMANMVFPVCTRRGRPKKVKRGRKK